MVNAVLFVLHAIFIGYIFYTKYRDESISEAFLNLALIVILIAVGSAISDSLVKLFIDGEGFGKELDRDTISLTVLSIFEVIFYRYYFFSKEKTKANETEK